jgi:hypothetical protein
MSVNGIWKVEILTPDGWESMSTAFMEDGKYRAGSRYHYAVGTYQVSDNRVKVAGKYVAHGQARAMFGKKADQMDLEFEGEIDGDLIQGQATEGEGHYQVSFRARRLADLA